MVRRYNGIMSRNVMTCSVVLDKGKEGLSGALGSMKIKDRETTREEELLFDIEEETVDKTKELRLVTHNLPEYK